MKFSKLPIDFYKRDTLTVAKEILGKYLIRNINGIEIIGKIVEVEAYLENDPASHSFKGKREGNKVMFLEGGHLYVYFTYGMYFCSNIVTEDEGTGTAVLLRAVEPVQGLDIIRSNRTSAKRDQDLANGPGKLCMAFQIDKSLNGVKLNDKNIYLAKSDKVEYFSIKSTTRIGISNGKEKKWRFFIEDNPYVSKFKQK